MPPPKPAATTPAAPTQPTSTPTPSPPRRQTADPAAPKSAAPPRRKAVSQQERDEAMNLPLVKQIVDLFDARLVDLQEQKPVPPKIDETDADVDASDMTEDDDDV